MIGARVGAPLVPLHLSFVHRNGHLDIQTITTPGDSQHDDRTRSAHRARARARSIHHSKAEILAFPKSSHTYPSDAIQRISTLPLAGSPRVHVRSMVSVPDFGGSVPDSRGSPFDAPKEAEPCPRRVRQDLALCSDATYVAPEEGLLPNPVPAGSAET